MKKKWWFIALVVIVLLLVVGYLAGGYLVYDQMTNVVGSCDPHKSNQPDLFTNVSEWKIDDIPEFEMSNYFMPAYEEVRFPSRETKYGIAGWYVEGDPDKPAVILVDGMGGCRWAQAVLVPAGMLWRNGFNVLIIDLHETGDSEIVDGHTTMGTDEYLDVLGAWDWLMAEKGFSADEIGITANSLGAATSLYAYAQEPAVAALFLNSPFANLTEILETELVRAGFPAQLVPPAILMGRMVGGVNVLEQTPLTAMANIGDRPLFVVHSSDDQRIDIDHSHQLEAAAEAAGVDSEFWYIDTAGHVRGPAFYPEAFEAKLVDFFERTLE